MSIWVTQPSLLLQTAFTTNADITYRSCLVLDKEMELMVGRCQSAFQNTITLELDSSSN